MSDLTTHASKPAAKPSAEPVDKPAARRPEKLAQKSVPQLIEDTLRETYEDTIEIVSAKIAMAKLDIADMIAAAAAALVTAIIGFIGLVYLFIAAAIYLGELLGRASAGYLVMGTVVLLIAAFFAKVKPDLLKNLFRGVLDEKLSTVGDGTPIETVENIAEGKTLDAKAD